ncbi:hypothetical protein [Stenotrophomonas sp. CC120222-04]|uniref:hypothetical protein n=1 Tax=Stenotrophomonas sp. CC120222-04 TaxID=1378088 RepID=UPI000B7214F4|nr:hypothetical protein [Stenotrophomonas sp. CC120222-04]SNT83516.1 hypothetical protein SAMN02744786_3358 [Stenotrophomonas sp. CC120222-04]
MKFYGGERLRRLVLHADAGRPKAARKAIDVLRVGLWFEELRARMGCTTAYSLGQLVQPLTYKKGFHHNNLWAKYAGGRHIPNAVTRRACEQSVPGSDELLTSPAWDALDVTQPLQKHGEALLRCFRPSIQSAMFDKRYLVKGLYVRRGAIVASLRTLEAQADLQSLAAMVVLLRDADARGDRANAFMIGQSLHRTLLMATIGSPLRFISVELFEYFIRIIFPMAAEKEFMMDVDQDMLCTQVKWLTQTAAQLHSDGRPGFTLNGSTGQLRRLFQPDFGFDLMFGLGPRLKLIVPAEEAGAHACNRVKGNNALCEWGRSVLGAGKCERILPEHISLRIKQPSIF